MNIAKTVVNRPTTFLIIYALIIGLALYILPQVPVDLLPEISPPILVVFTDYPGAGPEEVEQTVTRPMEGALTNVSGVKKITSTSSEGTSTIILELSWGMELAESTNEVRDKLEFVKEFLPDEAGSPQIFKFDPSLIPIMSLTIEGNRSPDELYTIATHQVQPRLEQVDGVALVSIEGGRDRAIRVEISQNRLEAYNLTLTQVAQALAAQNIQIGSGSVYEGNFKYLVETQGRFDNLEDIRNAVITYRSGGPPTGQNTGKLQAIRLRDFAEISDDYRDTTQMAYVNGIPSIHISMQKQSGTNSVEVSDNITAKLNEIRSVLPAGVGLTVIYDTTKVIRQSLRGVTSSAIIGAILAMAVLFVFLRSFKSTFIIGLSIPISLLVTIMVMYFSGLTLNIMTLAGLTLGIGMIVDSSIVILENIFRYREKGAMPKPAAHLGSQEMITAISASILTTVGIFLPLLMFKNELDLYGVLFQDLALTIIIALLASLIIAVSLVPVLSSKYLVLFTRKQRPIKNRFLGTIDSRMDRTFKALDESYKKTLAKVLDHKFMTLLIILLIFIISLVVLEPLGLGGNVGIELMPDQAQDVIQINVELPIGTRHEMTEDVLNQIASIAAKELQGYQDIFTLAGNDGGFFGGDATNRGVLWITLPPFEEQIDSYEVMLEKLRSHYDEFPSASFSSEERGFGGGGSPIDIVLRTENLDKARDLALEIKDLLANEVDEVIEPQISLNDGLPIARIVLDRDKAYSLGLNIHSIANEISAAVDGKTAGRYRSGGEEIDVLVILREEDRREIPDLERIFVLNQRGERIPVSSIGRIERAAGPVAIEREDRSRVVHISAKLKPGVNLNIAQPAVKRAISENVVIDDDVVLEYAGDFAELVEYGIKFLVVMLVALALVYGIMASLFESLLDPFVIFWSIILIIPGILLLYGLMNMPFFTYKIPLSLFSAVGLMMLVGIAVNNGIVLIDYINLLRNRELDIRKACIEAGGSRLRPILMTSLTTILGMVPLAFGRGEGAELVRPIGQTIIGGMAMSTLLMLFFVPTLYVYFNLFAVYFRRIMKQKPLAVILPFIIGAGLIYFLLSNAPSSGMQIGTLGKISIAFIVPLLIENAIITLLFIFRYRRIKKKAGGLSFCHFDEVRHKLPEGVLL